jgi:serine/threonine protein kinase
MTDYVTTRWYRAPEVLVGWHQYGPPMDLWAAGCIIAELATREPLFPGGGTREQIVLICSILGKPPEKFIGQVRKTSYRYVWGEIVYVLPALLYSTLSNEGYVHL